MEKKVKAICVKSIDYKDNDKLLTLISFEEGKLTAKMRGVRSPKSKLKLAASPLSFGEYILSSGKGGAIVTGMSAEDNFFSSWESLDKYAASQAVLEILDKSTIEGVLCREELMLSLKAISAINYSECSPYIMLVWFGVNLFPALGRDIDEIELNESAKKVFSYVKDFAAEELDCLDVTARELIEAMIALSGILTETLNTKINSFKEILRLLIK